jgi:hypothetical protein
VDVAATQIVQADVIVLVNVVDVAVTMIAHHWRNVVLTVNVA